MQKEKDIVSKIYKEIYGAFSLESWRAYAVNLQSLFNITAKTFLKDKIYAFYDEKTNHLNEKMLLNSIFSSHIHNYQMRSTFEQFWMCANTLKHDPLSECEIDTAKAKQYAELYNSFLESISKNGFLWEGINIGKLVVNQRLKRRINIIRLIGNNPTKALVLRDEVLSYAKSKVLCPIIDSNAASVELKDSMRRTIVRIEKMNVLQAIDFVKGLVISEENRPNDVAKRIKESGFLRFEDVIEEFRIKFSIDWIEYNIIR